MEFYQARGYYLEEIVRTLMNKSNFINVKTGIVEGRGADHQIDSYGEYRFPVPFIYPIRLISEAKWFSNKYKVQLNHVRDFLSVVLDISENYFVPRSNAKNQVNPYQIKDRYTDCGAFFSATGFTSDAQNFAWAHGVFLESFTNDVVLSEIFRRATQLLRQDGSWRRDGFTKKDVIELAQQHFSIDNILVELFRTMSAYVGLLDGIYPVIITARGKLRFDPRLPDDLTGEDVTFRENMAFKERRIEEDQDVNFQFNYNQTFFNFSLPVITASKLIQAIDKTYGGEPFGFLDIPTALTWENGVYRRIYRLKLALPYRQDIVETLRNM